MGQYYNFKNIFALLTEGFSTSELKTMCFVEPALRPMYENWSDSANKADMVRSIVDYAHQKLVIEAVLNWAEENNDLGYGIILGGIYQDVPLEIAATGWAEYGSTWVRSGWLFVPQLARTYN